jgi:lipopolysaccharide/colanic/teichoic acid biosynthesis glycosyltransferase
MQVTMAAISVPQGIRQDVADPLWKCIEAGERIFAVLLLIAISPLLAALGLAILLLSRRSPLIAHRRVGLNGVELWVLKFRTMWSPDSRWSRGGPFVERIDDRAGPARKQQGDPRVCSRFARFCRKHSLDELPQLIHVARGEMSLVGPRPVTFPELRRIYGSVAETIIRVKPGLTGLWQVSGRSRLTAAQRRLLDLECASRRSARLYFRVLARTIPEIVSGRGAW